MLKVCLVIFIYDNYYDNNYQNLIIKYSTHISDITMPYRFMRELIVILFYKQVVLYIITLFSVHII